MFSNQLSAPSYDYGAITDHQNLDGDLEDAIETSEGSPSFSLFSQSHRQVRDDDDALQANATIPSEVANITKNLLGGGVLSLSGGIALFADSPMKASLCSIGTVVVLGATMGFFCLLIGKVCERTGSCAYRTAWERSVGKTGGRTVAIVNTLDPLLGIFGNAIIMSQSLQLMLQGVIGVYWTVQTCLLFITIVAILPLCLMKNISALAPFSTLGMAAVLTALGAMTIRYLDGSYQAPDGVFYKDLSQDKAPSFGTRNHFFSTESLPFVCMVYTSFDMHYNSPRYYGELRDASIDRFRFAVSVSFTAGSILLFSIAVVGFLTFGGNSDSFILNSYSPRDPLATLCRIAIGLCSLIAYPLNFLGIRNNCLDIFGLAHKIDTRTKFNAFTILLLSILTLISCFATDLGLINSIGGGTTVTLVDFVFPALMYRAIIRKNRGSVMRERIEAWIAMGIMVIGVMLGLIGVWDAIVKAVSAQRHQGVSSPS